MSKILLPSAYFKYFTIVLRNVLKIRHSLFQVFHSDISACFRCISVSHHVFKIRSPLLYLVYSNIPVWFRCICVILYIFKIRSLNVKTPCYFGCNTSLFIYVLLSDTEMFFIKGFFTPLVAIIILIQNCVF